MHSHAICFFHEVSSSFLVLAFGLAVSWFMQHPFPDCTVRVQFSCHGVIFLLLAGSFQIEARGMFSSMFFPFSCHFKQLFFGFPVRSAENVFSLSVKRFFIRLRFFGKCAHVAMKKAPENNLPRL